ncbi:CDP-alcohol phosphatidyltransferase family protein [Desulfogranum mediterraneum]|uniref:CDP-alcohol phosphatidyltransferase family protein n=1 Tax=Desulfogranum mediterraneum TaxID=160661 RepID=UPI00041555C2|nr:CDP-alcohol phosphatidyltransferase family protein [Desulfogranum mediterraneum]
MVRRYIRFIPNTLSMLRLLLAAIFPFSPPGLWLWLIIGSGCSDVLDGWIARRWQLQSRLGAILDGVADKLFILAALLTLAGSGAFSFCWIPLLLARDLLVAFTAVYAAAIRSWGSFNKMEVRWPGKLATAAQFLLLLTAVIFPRPVSPPILWLATTLSVLAASDYGRLFVLELRLRAAAKEGESGRE